MSASERLKALEISTRAGTTALNYERVRSLDELATALPHIVAVVEAAEDGRDHSLMLQSEPAGVEMTGWSLDRAQKLHAALSALEEALS